MTPDLAQKTKQGLLPGVYGLWGDHRIEITDMIAEGDTVWARVATSGGHTGEWRGIAADRQAVDEHRCHFPPYRQRQGC